MECDDWVEVSVAKFAERINDLRLFYADQETDFLDIPNSFGLRIDYAKIKVLKDLLLG